MEVIKKYIKFSIAILILSFTSTTTFACEACNQNQPKILRNITHGNGPQSNWDYFVVFIMVAITLYTLYATIKCFVMPKERKYNQIKNSILKS
jgi:hypothetical protein